MQMATKLNQHAELIKRLYAESGNAKATHKNLRGEGVDVCYESVRQWLQRHAQDLPTLRSGGGKPKFAEPEQLFGFFPKNNGWMPVDGIYPEFFMVFKRRAKREYKDCFLAGFLAKFGVEFDPKASIDAVVLPLKLFRNFCDLEVYFFAYLLSRQGALVGVSDREFDERIRAITPLAIALREIIKRQSSISLGELRARICQATG